MGFILSKLLWWLFSPGNLILISTLIGGFFCLIGWKRWGRRLVGFGILALLALALLPVGDLLMRPLENRFAPPVLPEKIDGVIVLGGAIGSDLSRDRKQVSLNASADRLLAMAELARRYPDAPVLYASGSASLDGEGAREADYIVRILPVFGLPAERILLERDSRNTYENALNAKRMLAPSQAEGTWLLVTSASHMPRAMGVFRQQRWNVIAYPVDYTTFKEGSGSSFSVMEGMEITHWAVREWLGLAYYRLMGWTGAFFPEP